MGMHRCGESGEWIGCTEYTAVRSGMDMQAELLQWYVYMLRYVNRRGVGPRAKGRTEPYRGELGTEHVVGTLSSTGEWG